MKVLMAAMGLDIGGAETHIVELSKALQAQGHEVLIASNGGAYLPEVTAAGIRHFSVPMHRRDLACMRASRRLLKEIIRTERPDVVHAHARIPAFLCGTLQLVQPFPFVTTAHWVFRTGGGLRYLTNWGQRTIAVSDDIREYLVREYRLPREQISVTINGIDTEKFSPENRGGGILVEFGLDPSLPVLSYVSRMDADRALVARQLIEIAPRLAQAVPGIQMLLAGGGGELEELSALAAAVNVQLGYPCLTMTGPRTDISEIVAAGEVFVGVSRSALEAMSAGKPVIVAGNEGYQGLFTPQGLEAARAGNFCCRGMEPSVPQRLLEDITAAFALPQAEKDTLGAYGRQVISRYYSVQRMAEDCLAAYDQVRRRKYRVLVSGYYGYANAGDDAVLQSICRNIRDAGDEVELTVLSKDPADTRRRCGVRALPRFRLWSVLGALKKCDALLFGGGSLLQDRTSTRSLLYYLAVIRGAERMGKPVMLYANGIGPVDRPANRRRVKKAVERATLVTLRDHSSAQELEEMGVHRQLHITADPVFRLPPAPPEAGRDLLARAGLKAERPFAVISVRDWPRTGNFPQELAALCAHLYRAHGLELLFLPMQPARDLPASRRVIECLEVPAHLLDCPATPAELMAVLGLSHLCVAMRLHTLIFAARMSVPMLGLVYDPKVDSYLRELDMPAAGHVSTFSGQEAIKAADGLLADYETRRTRLAQRAQALTHAAGENDRLLLDMLRRHKP